MAAHSWAENVLLGKQPRSPRGLVEDCVILTASMPNVAKALGISMSTTLLRPLVFRHWLKCPTCQKRMFKLYLPPGAKVFGCRKCHHLTYKSSLKRNPDGSPRKAKPKPLVPAQEGSVTHSLWTSENTKWLPRPDPLPPASPELAKWLPLPRLARSGSSE